MLVPGGVTLPPARGEDAGTIQTLGARYAHGLISLEDAASLGCAACASSGGGCQFLGTAATAQVVGEALGLAVGHTALAPSGEPVWLEGGLRAVAALAAAVQRGQTTADVLSDDAVHNAMVVHAAFGGSTNLLLHVPAIAHAAGLRRPTAADWLAVARSTPRIVSVLPNGPVQHPTVRVYLAGGVPEVMLHLRDLGLLRTRARVVEGTTLDERLDAWRDSERRQRFRQILAERGFDPDEVIFAPDRAREVGMAGTVAFPVGNLAPEGSVVKATAIDPRSLDADGVYRFTGPARVFTDEHTAIEAIKTGVVQAGEVIALIGCGPAGTGMEETYQLTSALKHVPFGRQVALLTDARFSGVSTGACIGHVGPGGPGRRTGGAAADRRPGPDRDRHACSSTGTLDFVGRPGAELTPGPGRGRAGRPAAGRRAGPAPRAARRHPALGRPAAGQRRHLGRLRLRRGRHRRGWAELDAPTGPAGERRRSWVCGSPSAPGVTAAAYVALVGTSRTRDTEPPRAGPRRPPRRGRRRRTAGCGARTAGSPAGPVGPGGVDQIRSDVERQQQQPVDGLQPGRQRRLVVRDVDDQRVEPVVEAEPGQRVAVPGMRLVVVGVLHLGEHQARLLGLLQGRDERRGRARCPDRCRGGPPWWPSAGAPRRWPRGR